MIDHEALWLPSSNMSRGRWLTAWQRAKVEFAIIHTTEGGYEGSLNWLRGAAANSANRESSAHYLMDELGGRLAGLVDEDDTAHTAGNWSYNVRSVNIEFVGWALKGGFSEAVYRRLGSLVQRIAARHRFPVDRHHVIGHGEVPHQSHFDPGPFFDWDKLIFYAKGGKMATTPTEMYFEQTGCKLSGGFLGYWLANGGVPVFGFPKTNEIYTGNAKNPAIQWFERGRLEWWPETDPENFDVRRGLVGNEVLDLEAENKGLRAENERLRAELAKARASE